MKTTLEIPDALFRRVKSKAAERGQSLKEFVGEALAEKLSSRSRAVPSGDPGWMQGFGQLQRLRRDTRRVEKRIRDAFEVIEPEDRS
jgi:hypothetical protein